MPVRTLHRFVGQASEQVKVLQKRCNGKFAAKMNLANAIHHAGCLFKLLCVRMVGSPDTDRSDTSQDSPGRINERRSDFSRPV